MPLAADLALPLAAVTQTFAILAVKGGGKTFTAVALVGTDLPPRPTTTAEVPTLRQGALRAGEWRMLEALVAAHPGLTRAELGARTGMTPLGGTFGAYLGTLRRNGPQSRGIWSGPAPRFSWGRNRVVLVGGRADQDSLKE